MSPKRPNTASFQDASSPEPATKEQTEELNRPALNLDSLEKRVRGLEFMVEKQSLELASTHELSNQQALQAVEMLSLQMQFLRFERLAYGKNPLPTKVDDLKSKILRFKSKSKWKPEKDVEEALKEEVTDIPSPGSTP